MPPDGPAAGHQARPPRRRLPPRAAVLPGVVGVRVGRGRRPAAPGRGRARPGRRPRPGGPRSATAALPRLEAAITARPDDLLAYQAEGIVLGRLGRLADGLAALRAALARAPDTESALAGAANLADRLGRRDEAIADVRRAIAKSPWRTVYHANLAAFYFDARDWRGATASGRDALRLNPKDLESRKRLVRALLHAGDRERGPRGVSHPARLRPPGSRRALPAVPNASLTSPSAPTARLLSAELCPWGFSSTARSPHRSWGCSRVRATWETRSPGLVRIRRISPSS